MSYTLAVVPPLLVDLLWLEVEPLLKKAISKRPDDIDLEHEHKLLVSGNEILVVVYKEHELIAVNTLEVRTYGTGKRTLVSLNSCGTDLEEWIGDYLALTDLIGKDFGCSTTMGISTRYSSKGRDAWLRMINKYSKEQFKQVYTYLERKIT